jgi:hypothetical protein
MTKLSARLVKSPMQHVYKANPRTPTTARSDPQEKTTCAAALLDDDGFEEVPVVVAALEPSLVGAARVGVTTVMVLLEELVALDEMEDEELDELGLVVVIVLLLVEFVGLELEMVNRGEYWYAPVNSSTSSIP